MITVEELKEKARAGDLQALQELRDRGFFRENEAAEGYPVSHAQRRLWIVDQMVDGGGAYNIPIALRLEGALNAVALRGALQAIVRRHESLRTTFATVDGALRQFVHEEMDLPWEEQDLSEDADAEERAKRIAADHASRPFDLARGPLLRAGLVRLAPDRHLLLFNIHHIVSDLASMGILVRELSACYETCACGRPPSLAPLAIQYKDFAIWQNRLLAGDEAARHRSYWLDQLAGPLSPLNLPADFARPPLKTYRGNVCRTVLPAGLTVQLRQLGLRHGLTLFMVLAASLKVLLYRYTEQEDIIVGFPVAGRDHSDLAGQLGCFVNMLALRDRLAANQSFVSVLGRVRQTMLDAYEHQAYPFDNLVEELDLPRGMSRTPVFDVSISLVPAEDVALRLGDVKLSVWEDGFAASKFDMSFDFYETGDELELALSYCTDLFRAESVRRLADHCMHLMTSAVENPEQIIGRMPMLSAAERQQLLALGVPSVAPAWPARTLVELFERQAELNPESIALILPKTADDVALADSGPRETLSYGELNARANRLAHVLGRLGVGPDVVVGLCLPRSLDLVVALLGILKAGGTYLPLDISHPPERWAFMIDDARASVVLTQEALIEKLTPTRARIMGVDRDNAMLSRESADNPERVAGPDHLAYVIYTSGSTGQPKGVAVTQRNVTRLFAASESLFGFDERDVWTLFHSSAFDFSVWELWGALLHGGRVVIVPYGVSRSPNAFYELLADEAVTVLNQTPSAFRQLMQVEEDATASRHLCLRYVIFGGEALDPKSLRPWFARHGDAKPRLVNMYGITETTVHVTWRPLTMADLNASGSRIGKPLPDRTLYLLDAHREPVPMGVAGEIYVGGGGVARGYLNCPLLTAERFIPDPFDPGGAARLYRSGDLARFVAPDADLEYLGRIDHQVQIRGFRVELGEIESVLGAHAEVREAVVLAQGQGAEMRLIGYFTAVPGVTPASGALRQFLRDKLPEYMVPAAFILLDEMPLTTNGKIDRKALPAPEHVQPDLHAGFVAPRDNLERALAGFFAEVLRVEGVGADSNFFELGGNSLLATRIVSRVRETFRVALTIPQFFRAGNVVALAASVRSISPAGQADKIAGALLRLQGMSTAEKQALLNQRDTRGALRHDH